MKESNFNNKDRVFIVAEIGNNHEGNFEVAKELIKEASAAGADAVKFQTYIPEKYVTSSDYKRVSMLKKFQLSNDEFLELAKFAKQSNIILFSTPFDLESASFLNTFQDIFKISSGDNNFIQLIEKVFEFGKPTIISTGITDLNYIKNIYLKWLNNYTNFPLAFLHCVSSYPVPETDANINVIKNMINEFPNAIIGYSDHTIGIEASIAAVSLGAKIIEKHFTLDKNYSEFRDHQLSSDPKELKILVKSIRKVEIMMGNGIKRIQPCEKDIVKAVRRSIAAKKNMPINHQITLDDLTWVRPGIGTSPGDERKIIGKRLKKTINMGEIILPEMLKE